MQISSKKFPTETTNAMSKINFSGNIIPHSWFHHLIKTDRGDTKLKRDKSTPYLHAIIILSDICYWYRNTEVRDESSGGVIGYERKFSADMLQRSYTQICDQFGLTKSQAKRAIDYLVENGYINRFFRGINTSVGYCANVMFIEPISSKIASITDTMSTKTDFNPPKMEEDTLKTEMVPDLEGYPYQNCEDTPISNGNTYTETTTKTSTKNSIISQSESDLDKSKTKIAKEKILDKSLDNYSKETIKKSNSYSLSLKNPKTIQEVEVYCDEMGYSYLLASKFFSKMVELDWMYAGHKIHNWKKVLDSWSKNNYEKDVSSSKPKGLKRTRELSDEVKAVLASQGKDWRDLK